MSGYNPGQSRDWRGRWSEASFRAMVGGQKQPVSPTDLANAVDAWRAGFSWNSESKAAADLHRAYNEMGQPAPALYRGLGWNRRFEKEPADAFVGKLVPGKTVTLPIGSWSESSDFSNEVAGNYGESDYMQVVFDMAPGANGLNVQGIGLAEAGDTEREWVTGGTLKVESIDRSIAPEGAQKLTVRVTQVAR